MPTARTAAPRRFVKMGIENPFMNGSIGQAGEGAAHRV
jgi:hypothetical protein